MFHNTEPTKRPVFIHVKDDEYALRIDNTTLSTFTKCPRAGEYYAIDRKQAIPTPALAFGNAIHKGLECLYKNGFTSVGKAAQDTLDALSDYTIDENEWRTPELAVETIGAYVKHYMAIPDLSPMKRPDGTKCVEIPFSLPFGELELFSEIPFPRSFLLGECSDPFNNLYISKLHIFWTGKIDVLDDTPSGVFVVDHKTSSMGGAQFFADFELSNQMIGYNWAARQIFPDAEIRGTTINAIIQRKPTRTGTAREFSRQTHFVSDWHINEWRANVSTHIANFLRYLVTPKPFPQITANCFSKYGKCHYHDVCTLPPKSRRLMLSSSQYTDVIWSPLE